MADVVSNLNNINTLTFIKTYPNAFEILCKAESVLTRDGYDSRHIKEFVQTSTSRDLKHFLKICVQHIS